MASDGATERKTLSLTYFKKPAVEDAKSASGDKEREPGLGLMDPDERDQHPISLCLNDAMWEQSKQASLERLGGARVSNVVSFLGSTQAGKSYTIRHLLEGAGLDLPRVADSKSKMKSTTAGVQAYPCPGFPGVEGLIFLDMEGNNGTTPVEDADERKDMKPQERRDGVDSHLPRLAYVVSDLVVYVSDKPLADATWFKAPCELAMRATNNVASDERPTLLLIRNKAYEWDEDDEDDIITDDVKKTAEFFEERGDEDEVKALGQWYSDVFIFHLPKRKEKSKESVALYNERTKELRAVIRRLLDKRMEERRRLGNCYPPAVWWELFRLVVETFNVPKPLRMGEVLSLALLPANTDVPFSGIYQRFTAAIHLYPHAVHKEIVDLLLGNRGRDAEQLSLPVSHVPVIRSHQYALGALATVYAVKIRRTESRALHGERVSLAQDKYTIIHEEIHREIKLFLERLMAVRPCGAVLQPKKGPPIHCTQVLSKHEEKYHFNPDYSEFFITKKGKLVKRSGVRGFIANVKKTIGSKEVHSPGKWGGPFDWMLSASDQVVVEAPGDTLESKFRAVVFQDLMSMFDREFKAALEATDGNEAHLKLWVRTMKALRGKDIISHVSKAERERCSVCFRSQSPVELMCGHSICGSCFKFGGHCRNDATRTCPLCPALLVARRPEAISFACADE